MSLAAAEESLPTGHSATPPPTASGLSFTQGFVLGQLSILLLVVLFIKFFIFGDPPDPKGRRSSNAFLSPASPSRHALSFTPYSSPSRRRRRSTIKDGRGGDVSDSSSDSDAPSVPFSHIVRPPPPLTPAAILAKTYYDVNAHPPESLDWFNVLVAQALAQLRADAVADGGVLTSLTAVLNGPHRPDFCEEIRVTEISLGESFPIFSNCRVHPVREGDDDNELGWTPGRGKGKGGAGAARLLARMDVDLADALTLGIETTLVLNYPRPGTARLPVALSVSVARFSGTLAISFQPAAGKVRGRTHGAGATAQTAPSSTSHPPGPRTPPRTPPPSTHAHTQQPFNPSSQRTPTTLSFAFQPSYHLSLSTRSLLGSRARLQDVPKIAQLVEARLRAWFEDRCVAPRRQQIAVPSLWPRMHNVVVEPEGDGDGEGEAGIENKAGGGTLSVPAAGEQSRDVHAEARREIEAELQRRRHAEAAAEEQMRREREREREREGVRRRAAAAAAASSSTSSGQERGLNMPGAMP